MYFIVLAFLAVFFGASVGYYLHTQSQIRSNFRRSGPRAISEWIGGRNKKGLVIALILIVFIALLEAFIPDVGYFVQDLQASVQATLPEQGIVFLSRGSISWALYLSIFSGFALGVLAGSRLGCAQFSRTSSFGTSEVL